MTLDGNQAGVSRLSRSLFCAALVAIAPIISGIIGLVLRSAARPSVSFALIYVASFGIMYLAVWSCASLLTGGRAGVLFPDRLLLVAALASTAGASTATFLVLRMWPTTWASEWFIVRGPYCDSLALRPSAMQVVMWGGHSVCCGTH